MSGSAHNNLHRLFVYGSFQRGAPAHRLLHPARFLGTARTEASFQMVDLGAYPAMIAGGRQVIEGELYKVDGALLERLDRYEEHPFLYTRSPIRLAGGEEAFSYLLSPGHARGKRRLPGGRWRIPTV